MVTGVDIKLEPVPGGISGELFKFRLKTGVTFTFNTEIGSLGDEILTVSEGGDGIQDRVFMIPIRNIRYIFCYYE
jgi:hypothetical protein